MGTNAIGFGRRGSGAWRLAEIVSQHDKGERSAAGGERAGAGLGANLFAGDGLELGVEGNALVALGDGIELAPPARLVCRRHEAHQIETKQGVPVDPEQGPGGGVGVDHGRGRYVDGEKAVGHAIDGARDGAAGSADPRPFASPRRGGAEGEPKLGDQGFERFVEGGALGARELRSRLSPGAEQGHDPAFIRAQAVEGRGRGLAAHHRGGRECAKTAEGLGFGPRGARRRRSEPKGKARFDFAAVTQ